jgi:hypothetical protein
MKLCQLASAPGSMYLFHSHSNIKWNKMPAQWKEDWYIFFDMCRDSPTPYTELFIDLISGGLCPQISEYEKNLTALGRWNKKSKQNRDWAIVKCWVIPITKIPQVDGLPNRNEYPEMHRLIYPHYYIDHPLQRVVKSFYSWKRHESHEKVMCFFDQYIAWEEIFSWMHK